MRHEISKPVVPVLFLILLSACAAAHIDGPTAADINEPVKLSCDVSSPRWVFVGEGVTSGTYGSGRWVVLHTEQETLVTAVLAFLEDDGSVGMATHQITVGQQAEKDEPPPDDKLDKLFESAAETIPKTAKKQQLANLAQGFRLIAAHLHSGEEIELPSTKQVGRITTLNIVKEQSALNRTLLANDDFWKPFFEAIGLSLDAIAEGGGLKGPQDYETTWLSIARVLERRSQ